MIEASTSTNPCTNNPIQDIKEYKSYVSFVSFVEKLELDRRNSFYSRTGETSKKGLNNWNYGSIDGRKDREQYSAGVSICFYPPALSNRPPPLSLSLSNLPTLSRSFSLVHRRATSKIIILSQVRFNRGGPLNEAWRLACMPRNRGRMCFTRYIMHKREQERVLRGNYIRVRALSALHCRLTHSCNDSIF